MGKEHKATMHKKCLSDYIYSTATLMLSLFRGQETKVITFASKMMLYHHKTIWHQPKLPKVNIHVYM